MNVLYVLKRYPRLSETFIAREIIELERRGVDVAIDALLPPEDGPRHPLVAAVRARVRYVPRRPHLADRHVAAVHARIALRHPVVWIREARRARRAETWRRFLQAGFVALRARRQRADVIHAHFATAAAEVAGHASALTGIPFTVTAHAKDIFADANAHRLGQRIAGAATVVTVSDHNRRHLRDVLPNTRVTVVRNGVPRGEAFGPMLGGPVLTVARLVEKKGIDVLIAAMGIVRDRHPSARLEIIGQGPLREVLEHRAEQAGIRDRVTFHGAQSSDVVEAHYARASMVVLPCRVAADGDRDGLPTVLVEAMSHALPVVSTDVVGIAELIDHERTGLLTAVDDPIGLAEAICRLLDDPSFGEAMGCAGRRRVIDTYDPAVSARALETVFAGAER